MAIEKLMIMDGCIACGVCESMCPEVFEMGEIAVVLNSADLNENEEQIRLAAKACPVSVIKIEERMD